MVEDFTVVLVWLLLLLFSTFGFCLWILVADAVIPVAVTAKTKVGKFKTLTPRVIFCTTVAMWFCMCLLLWIRFFNNNRIALLWGSMSVWSCFLRVWITASHMLHIFVCIFLQLADFLFSTKCKCEAVIDKILSFYVWRILQTVQHEMMLLYAVCIGTEP